MVESGSPWCRIHAFGKRRSPRRSRSVPVPQARPAEICIPGCLVLGKSESRPGLHDRSGDVGFVGDKPVMVLPMLGIGELGGVCSRIGLRLLEDALDVVKGDA